MTALEIVKANYLGTSVEAIMTTGILTTKVYGLDCDCIEGEDCSSKDWTGDCDD